MTFSEAKEIIAKGFYYQEREKWDKAQGYLEGREAGIKESANMMRIEFYRAHIFLDPNDGVRYIEKVILDILERKP